MLALVVYQGTAELLFIIVTLVNVANNAQILVALLKSKE